MTFEEKRKLSHAMGSLAGERLVHVLQIIAEGPSAPVLVSRGRQGAGGTGVSCMHGGTSCAVAWAGRRAAAALRLSELQHSITAPVGTSQPDACCLASLAGR